MAEDFKPGDRINITIENAQVIRTGRDDIGRAFIEYTHGEINTLASVERDDPAVTIERTAPAQWPPRRGDVWKHTDGMRWFGIAHGSNVYLYSYQGDVMDPQQAYDERHELVFVDRADEQGGGGRG